MYDLLRSPVDYGGILLKNRIFFAPTTLGLPREEYFAKLRAIASGGCALVCIGDVPVSRHAPEISLYEAEGFAYYETLTSLVHAYDCKICAQLYLSDSNVDIFPECTENGSFLRSLKNDEIAPYLAALPAQAFTNATACFADATKEALRAGFDMVQVLGDRMIGSVCSAIFNTRTDEFGGSAENRARFACACVQAIRAVFPTLPIDYKLTVRQENPHYGNAGVLLEELPVFVPMLEQAGVTSFHVTLANHSFLTDIIPSCKHPYFGEEGCFLKYCDAVRRCTNVPICGVGALSSPDFIETQLHAGRIDCAAMSRQLIADPTWMSKVCSGEARSIRRCIRCNRNCIQGMMTHSGVHCFQEKCVD